MNTDKTIHGTNQKASVQKQTGRSKRRFGAVLLLAVALLLLSLPSLSRETTAAKSVEVCLQDDSNGNLITFSVGTGAYTFTNCAGFTIGGTGRVAIDGSTITLTDTRADRRVQASLDLTQKRAKASYQRTSPAAVFTIVDRNTANDTCGCPK